MARRRTVDMTPPGGRALHLRVTQGDNIGSLVTIGMVEVVWLN